MAKNNKYDRGFTSIDEDDEREIASKLGPKKRR
jgi:hypothetical protein